MPANMSSNLSFSVSGLTTEDFRSILESDPRCTIIGTHPKEPYSRLDESSTDTVVTWHQTEVKVDGEMKTQQGEKLFEANGQKLRIVYQWETNSSTPETPKTQTFWAVVSALD